MLGGLQGQSGTVLRLRNGDLNVAPNAATFAREFKPSKQQLHQGRYYMVVQFSVLPTQEKRAAIEAMGVRLLDYLPDNAYIASLPEGLDLGRLTGYGVRGFVVPDRSLRLSEELFKGEYPAWAMRGDAVELVVMPYRDIALGSVLTDLRGRFQVIEEYGHPRFATVRVLPSQLDALLSLPYVQFLEPVAPASTPDDIRGRSLHRSNVINSSYGAGRHFDGTGVTIGLADDGLIGPHIDYKGRLTQYATSNTGTHGDMTAGILFGAGNRNPDIMGHATGAYLHYWDIGGYVHILDAVANFASLAVIITSTSYSQGQGGMYTTDAEFIDDQIYDNPHLVHVFSAGNAGTANHGYGAGAGWANITGGYKASKSVITCGNLTNMDALDNTSSRGPADDGRIKPDICANGTDQLSTDAPNTDQVGGGTSAAAPSVAGCVTQLYHAYKTLNGGANPHSALIKACILNTGEDLGNPGPDYRYGWGRINALRAVRLLEGNQYIKDSVSQGQTDNHTITVPAGTQELRVMVYWTDYAGNPSASVALVNNLNMTVTNGTVYQPWILDPTPNATNLNANAVRGVDNLNNMEQVTITNPVAGTTTITIAGTSVPQGPQRYYIVYEFVTSKVEVTYPVGGEGVAPGDVQKIRWDAFGTSGTFTLEYSTDNGSNWTNIANNVGAAVRSYNWTVPNVTSGQARVRVTAGSLSDQSDAPFTIVRVPTNLQVVYVCPDSIGLSWSSATGASGYEASYLGAMYMDSATVTGTTSAKITGLNPMVSQWFSVASLTANNGQGRRAIAIEHPGGTFNCTIPVDVAIQALLAPGSGSLPQCQASATTPVVITVRNNGMSAASNIPVSFSVNGGAAVNEVVAGPIPAGGTSNYTFTGTANLGAPGNYTIDVWVSFPSDGNQFNDSLQGVATIVSSTSQGLPVTQNFETFTNCGTSSNCEAGTCALGNGWSNVMNLDGDDIDWRVDDGGTPSAGTGPDVDHNPGTSSGNYVYLEASGCNGKEALLMSPCINLVGATSPQATFWYHMFGGDMGELHVDVIADGIWTMDVIPMISGDQGNQWRQASVNLVPFVGKTINIRFRGITGNEFESDMALDDILVSEVNSAPVANFEVDNTEPCIGSTASFADLSVNSPNTWSWTITPGTFNYVGGTTQNSQNPQVQFTAAGTYTVALTASNGFGTNTFTRTAYIFVSNGVTAVTEDFQGNFLPTGWQLDDAGGSYTWAEATGITGANGQNTDAAFVENFAYNNVGAEDKLITMAVDLNNIISAQLTFDVAYAEYNASFVDALRVDISTDCGVSYSNAGYNKSGATLATAPSSNSSWEPTNANQWRNETVDLSPWIGQLVKVAFVNVNGYGNNVYVDNVNITTTVVGMADGLKGQWRVFPNPGSGKLTLEVDALAAGAANVRVYDLAGRQVHGQVLNGTGGYFRTQLNLSGLPSGIYSLELEQDGVREVKKLVLQ